MRLVIVLLRQMTVFPNLRQRQTAERLLGHRFFQNLTPKKHSGKCQHLFQFPFQTACSADAQKHFRLKPVQHPSPDDDRMILGNQKPFPQMGHLLRLLRQNGAEEGLIGLRLCLGGRIHLNLLPFQPVFCCRSQTVRLRQIEHPFAVTDTDIVPDGFGGEYRHD